MARQRIPASLEEHVVETGRERTLRVFELFFAGSMKVPGSRELHEQFTSLPPATQEFVRELVVKVVDETVFNTLQAIDYADDISIIADTNDRDDDLRVQLDGFADSYVDPEKGWRKRHGVHPRSVFDPWMDQQIDTSWLDRLPKADP